MKLLIIIACVFVALFLLVSFVERFTKPVSDKTMSRLSYWLPILVFISIVLGLMRTSGFF